MYFKICSSEGGSRNEHQSICRSCEALLKATKEAVEKKGIDAEVEYITDMEKIMGYGIMSMPALMIDDKIVSVGKVLKAKDVEKLL